ncbi:MAG: tetratricopeptide repeat protein [Novosphingobium sp.]
MICKADRKRSRPWLVVLPAILLAGPALGEGRGNLADAREALRRGDGIAAEALLRDALHRGTPAREVAAQMGEAELLQQDFLEAGRWLRPGDFSSSEQAHGYRMLGRLEMMEGDLEAAGKAFDEALRAAPRNAVLWVDIGRLRYLAGDQFAALDAAERALQIEPKEPGALEFRGQLIRDSKGPRAALPFFAAALKQAPENLSILGEYAATLGEAGRARDMLAVTRRMIEIDRRDPRAFYLQAVLAARAGKDDLARRLLWRTGDAYRKTPAAMLLTGVLELRVGNVQTAADVLDALWRMQPDNGQVAVLVARALQLDGRHAELVSRFAELARRGDASPYLLEVVGRSYEALERRDEAAFFLDRAAMLKGGLVAALPDSAPLDVLEARWRDAPGEPRRILSLVRQLLALGHYAKAQSIVAEVRGKFPGSSDVLFLSGDVELMAGNPQAALEHYRRVARIRMSGILMERMVKAELALGQAQSVESMVVAYFLQHPMDDSASSRIAQFAADRKDWQRAEAVLAFALRQGSNARDPLLLARSALAHVGLGDSKAALAEARKAYRLQPGNAYITRVYGLTLKAAGEEGSSGAMLAKVERLSTATGSTALGQP